MYNTAIAPPPIAGLFHSLVGAAPVAAPMSQTPVKLSVGGRHSWHYKSPNRDFRENETALPLLADSGDTIPETALEITPEMPPTPSSAK